MKIQISIFNLINKNKTIKYIYNLTKDNYTQIEEAIQMVDDEIKYKSFAIRLTEII